MQNFEQIKQDISRSKVKKNSKGQSPIERERANTDEIDTTIKEKNRRKKKSEIRSDYNV